MAGRCPVASIRSGVIRTRELRRASPVRPPAARTTSRPRTGILALQRTLGNRATARLLTPVVQRVDGDIPAPPPAPDFKHKTAYAPVTDAQAALNRAFRLTLSRNQGATTGTLAKLATVTKGVTYKDMENNTDRFGLPKKPSADALYKDFLTDYLLRAMFTATDVGGGGIVVNLAGYNKDNIAVINKKYRELLADKRSRDPNARWLTHREFMGADYTPEEQLVLSAPGEPPHTNPGFTDWEIATIAAIPEILAGAEFYDPIRHIDPSGWSDDIQDYKDMGMNMDEIEQYGFKYLPQTNLLTQKERDALLGLPPKT
jgi:hypothetical protein